MTYKELIDALELFGFTDDGRLTMSEFKNRHRDKLRATHPDLQNDSTEIQAINGAAEIISTYLKNYRFSFSQEEFYSQNPEERLRLQFADSPLWGSK